MKPCTKCDLAKPPEDFSKRAASKDGRRRMCRACEQEYRQTNAVRISARKRKHYAANLDIYSAARHRRRVREASAPHEPYKRSDVFARYGGACAYCDAPAEHLDHVEPISKGGADAPHNLLPACASCNLSKGAKSLAQWALTFGRVSTH